MAATMPLPKGVNLKLTESYLMNLVGVVDASVFWTNGDLNAFVTVHDQSHFTARDYQKCCMEDLGVHQTPRHITIDMRRLRVA